MHAREVAEYARKSGYRGICGIDGIIVDNSVYIVEFNPRFQGSTPVINRAFAEKGLPSVQELNIAAFEDRDILHGKAVPKLKINYSTYTYFNSEMQIFGNNILKNVSDEPFVAEVNTDGYKCNSKVNKNIYMFRIMFNGNITSLNTDGGVFVPGSSDDGRGGL